MKKRISVSIDEELAKEIFEYCQKRKKEKPPQFGEKGLNISNVYEEIIKKGWRATKK